MRWPLAHLLLLLLVTASGCVSHSGRPIDGAMVSRIQPGKTTMDECRQWFGEPMAQYVDGQAIGFTWQYGTFKMGAFGFGNQFDQQILTAIFTNGLVQKYVITGNVQNPPPP